MAKVYFAIIMGVKMVKKNNNDMFGLIGGYSTLNKFFKKKHRGGGFVHEGSMPFVRIGFGYRLFSRDGIG